MSTTNTVAGLNHFQIIGNGLEANGSAVNIYKNGRQQFSIEIIIEAIDSNGQIITVPTSDLKTVTLINHATGAPLGNTFVRSYAYAGYDHLTAVASDADTKHPRAMSTVQFWMHVKPNESAANIGIGAKITLDGVTYTTNNRNAPIGGKVESGGSNSWFTLTPKPAYRFGKEYFEIENKGGIGYGYDTGQNEERWLDLWQISFIDRNYKIYGSSFPSDTKPIPYFSEYTLGSKPYHCLWLLPVRRSNKDNKFYLGWQRDGRPHRLDCWIRPPTEDVALAVIESSNHFVGHHYASKVIDYIDNYGCSHSIYVRHNDNGKTLKLENP